MCGICGFVGDTLDGGDIEAGRRMRDVLVHRGPDGDGEALVGTRDDGPCGWFGHRRLKIIDLSRRAEQPMSSDDGRVTLTFNGEIYNFRELRRELEGCGHTFRSSGDTEVLLRAYVQWGTDCLTRLDGMFAFAIWDDARQILLLARDRTGKKPLFFATSARRVT